MFPVFFSIEDNIEACAEQEICHVPNGIARANQCVHKLSKKDIDLMTEIILRRYPEANDLKDVLTLGCKNVTGIKEISYTAAESLNIFQSRACLSLMVTECQLKRAMGFFKFGR
ncbi:hypothetical protein NPIL_30481 [Nephila pilipes]|uniref:Uncharacterized protein n=1 Tax=Nephila pilipes TaxID=299642 RepID=A0A8X6NN31_NEPPI|nr:hypothetical protein NPIL_30481 [Nephila pilipes]